jgi:hypothetical protein
MSARVNLFVKGNLDVVDTLYGQRIAGRPAWGGINEALRAARRDLSVRVRHETAIGFAALVAAPSAPPREVADRSALFGPFLPEAQFGDAVFTSPQDALVLSVQADLYVPLVRHRSLDYVLHPYGSSHWPPADQDWLRNNFVAVAEPCAESIIENLGQVILRYRASSDAPILVFNMSSVIAGETIHRYLGAGDVSSQRIRRVNCALVEASAALGFSIVDVDRIVAQHGARQLMFDPVHFNADGCRLVCEEVVRILDDYEVFPENTP